MVSADGRVLLDVGCYDLKRLPNTVIHDDEVSSNSFPTWLSSLIKIPRRWSSFTPAHGGSSRVRTQVFCCRRHGVTPHLTRLPARAPSVLQSLGRNFRPAVRSAVRFVAQARLLCRLLARRRPRLEDPARPVPGPVLLARQWVDRRWSGVRRARLRRARARAFEYREPTLHLHPRVVQERLERNGMLDDSDRPSMQHEVFAQRMEAFGEDEEVCSVDQKWRRWVRTSLLVRDSSRLSAELIAESRYVVQNMNYGWTLETVTGVREAGDCRGWFMNRAVDFSHTDEDLDDLVIGEHGLAYLLRPSLLSELNLCSVRAQVPHAHPSDPAVREEPRSGIRVAAHPILLRTHPHSSASQPRRNP